MCEYCGCQSLAVIDELTREHDTVVTLVSLARDAHRAADTPRLAELAREITAVLEPHTRVEEDGLFPAMADEFPEAMDALRAEHRRIEEVLGQAAGGTPADPAWPDHLIAVLDLLRAHILKEQDGVFPAALAMLEPEHWEAMEAIRARVAPPGSRQP